MKKIIATIVVFALAPVAGALAGGGSTLAGYGGTAGRIQGTVQKTGSLPFTGLNLTIVAVAAVALIVAGFFVRRAGRSS